jgi:hypothetical protein
VVAVLLVDITGLVAVVVVEAVTELVAVVVEDIPDVVWWWCRQLQSW